MNTPRAGAPGGAYGEPQGQMAQIWESVSKLSIVNHAPSRQRVAVYIDGFNLYHALRDLKQPKYKWINLSKLSTLLTRPQSQTVVSVKYFSAFANHFASTGEFYKLRRHRNYVAALRSKGVECIMGNFAKRDRHYSGPGYKARWRRYEEKQTDVAIGIHVVNDAYRDLFDVALVVSVDTDLLPMFEMMRVTFPNKPVICVAPPERAHHRDLQAKAAGLETIKKSQLEKAMFGERVTYKGKIVANRPSAWKP